MIVYGERLLAGPGGAQAARALLNLASRLGLAGRDGAGPARGARRPPTGAACARPASRPATAPATRRSPSPAATPRASPRRSPAASSRRSGCTTPTRCARYPDRAAWEAALGTAQTVIAVDSVLTDTIREHADVVFPAEAYAEKEGTLTHPDGRVQRLRPAIGRPKGPDRQSGSGVRPLWQVIADVAERAGLELGVRTGPMASQLLFDAVPFYAGLTLDAIGGRGVRWPASEAAARVRGRRRGSPPSSRCPTPCRRRPTARCASARSARCGASKEVDVSPVAALPAPAPGRRALARRRRAARHPRRRPGRGRLQRDARARAP